MHSKLETILFGIFCTLIYGLITFLLWNELMTKLFNLPIINYWEGVGLVLLSDCLFKGNNDYERYF